MNALSLFSNVGIAEIFFDKLNINTVVANEIDPQRVKFYNHIYPKVDVIQGDITDEGIKNTVINKSRKLKVDFILATPPCQGMSVAGKMLKWRDERNILVKYAIDIIKELEPKYAMFENVPMFPKTLVNINENGSIKQVHINDLIQQELGEDFYISYKILNAADLGVAQNRKRCVYLISNKKKVKESEYLDVEKINLINEKLTLKDVIGNLPSLEPINKDKEKYNLKFLRNNAIYKWHYAPVHADRHIKIMRMTPEGKSAYSNKNKDYWPRKTDGTLVKGFASTYKRIKWDEPAPTVTMANGSISSQNNVHPGRKIGDTNRYSDPRVLSILEIMRVMSIPDGWNIPEWASDNFIRSVIGEGIPPKMIYNVLLQIKNK